MGARLSSFKSPPGDSNGQQGLGTTSGAGGRCCRTGARGARGIFIGGLREGAEVGAGRAAPAPTQAPPPPRPQEPGSAFLQLGVSLEQQLQVLFKVLEEYDWSAFAVITSLHPGHALFLDGVRAVADASYLSWRLLDVLTLELGPGGQRAHIQRLLRQVDAPVLVAYCSREEAEVLFAEAAQAGLVGPGHVWLVPSLALGSTDTPPAAFPVGLISVVTESWRLSLRQKVRDGVAILALGAHGYQRQHGALPSPAGDCRGHPGPVSPAREAFYRWAPAQGMGGGQGASADLGCSELGLAGHTSHQLCAWGQVTSPL